MIVKIALHMNEVISREGDTLYLPTTEANIRTIASLLKPGESLEFEEDGVLALRLSEDGAGKRSLESFD